MFQRRQGQVLGFVNDKQGVFSAGVLLDDKVCKAAIPGNGYIRLGLQLIGCQNPAQQIRKCRIRVGYQADPNAFVKPVQQLADQGCFSCADLTADDAEPGLVENTKFQKIQRFLMLLTEKQEFRIWQQ